jgi:hypothetical protein
MKKQGRIMRIVGVILVRPWYGGGVGRRRGLTAQFVGIIWRRSEFFSLLHLLPQGLSDNSGFRSSKALLLTIEMACLCAA